MHSWWLKKILNIVGHYFGTYLNKNTDHTNFLWLPVKSHCMTMDFKLITDLSFNKFITINPFTHGGSTFGHSTFGNRGQIVKTLLDKGLDIDIYGMPRILQIKELENYSKYYKGTIGDRNKCDYGISKVQLLSEYKFIITIENGFTEGYITEKLCDLLLCNRVLIYFGDPNIEKLFPNLFPNGAINGFNFKSLDNLVYYIKNMSNEEYLNRIKIITQERLKIFKLYNVHNQLSYIIYNYLLKKKFDIQLTNDNIDELIKINNIVEHL